MINDLLNVSLITTGKLDLELTETNITALVRDITAEFSESLAGDGNSLTLTADQDVVSVVDKLRLEQVMSNLISNSIKYGNHKPIEVVVKKEKSLIKIAVIDQGNGIPESEQERIFALFERIGEGNGTRGFGVGLYISDQIVRAHNGRIKVKSQLNSGSTFTVELPIEKTLSA